MNICEFHDFDKTKIFCLMLLKKSSIVDSGFYNEGFK